MGLKPCQNPMNPIEKTELILSNFKVAFISSSFNWETFIIIIIFLIIFYFLLSFMLYSKLNKIMNENCRLCEEVYSKWDVSSQEEINKKSEEVILRIARLNKYPGFIRPIMLLFEDFDKFKLEKQTKIT